jgi:hypothetical protein
MKTSSKIQLFGVFLSFGATAMIGREFGEPEVHLRDMPVGLRILLIVLFISGVVLGVWASNNAARIDGDESKGGR